MSTFEAVAGSLAVLEGEAVAEPLFEFYRRANDRMLLVRGKLRLGDVDGGLTGPAGHPPACLPGCSVVASIRPGALNHTNRWYQGKRHDEASERVRMRPWYPTIVSRTKPGHGERTHRRAPPTLVGAERSGERRALVAV